VLKLYKISNIIWKQVIISLICAFFVAFGLLIPIAYIFENIIEWTFIVGYIFFFYILYNQKTIRKAVGMMFIIIAIESFATPVSAFIFAEKIVSETNETLETIGAAIGAGLGIATIGFVAFFSGISFLLLGYFIREHGRYD